MADLNYIENIEKEIDDKILEILKENLWVYLYTDTIETIFIFQYLSILMEKNKWSFEILYSDIEYISYWPSTNLITGVECYSKFFFKDYRFYKLEDKIQLLRFFEYIWNFNKS